MKNIFFLLILVLVTNINAQTTLGELDDDEINWELNEGDVNYRLYSCYTKVILTRDLEVLNKSQTIPILMGVKLYFSEDRTQLYEVALISEVNNDLKLDVFIVDDEYRTIADRPLIDDDGQKAIVFRSKYFENDWFAVIGLYPKKDRSMSILIDLHHSDKVYSTMVHGKNMLEDVWYEDILNNATKQEWRDRYKR